MNNPQDQGVCAETDVLRLKPTTTPLNHLNHVNKALRLPVNKVVCNPIYPRIQRR